MWELITKLQLDIGGRNLRIYSYYFCNFTSLDIGYFNFKIATRKAYSVVLYPKLLLVSYAKKFKVE